MVCHPFSPQEVQFRRSSLTRQRMWPCILLVPSCPSSAASNDQNKLPCCFLSRSRRCGYAHFSFCLPKVGEASFITHAVRRTCSTAEAEKTTSRKRGKGKRKLQIRVPPQLPTYPSGKPDSTGMTPGSLPPSSKQRCHHTAPWEDPARTLKLIPLAFAGRPCPGQKISLVRQVLQPSLPWQVLEGIQYGTFNWMLRMGLLL